MKDRMSRTGLVVFILFVLVALLGPALTRFDPTEIRLEETLCGPSTEHFFGQDKLGRDVFSRVVFGARISMMVGTLTVTISLCAGIFLGFLAGYYGGVLEDIIMRLVDILLAFPGILLAIALTAILGPSLRNVVMALCCMGWVSYARIVRAQVLTVRETEYVQAARSIGASDMRILMRHILPNILAPIIVEATFGMAGAILAEAGLSFLGLGTPPPTPSWGTMLNEGRNFLLVAPHMTLAPGIALMVVILGLNFLGDGLRDRFDVKQRSCALNKRG